jgi:hypothetical protein
MVFQTGAKLARNGEQDRRKQLRGHLSAAEGILIGKTGSIG